MNTFQPQITYGVINNVQFLTKAYEPLNPQITCQFERKFCGDDEQGSTCWVMVLREGQAQNQITVYKGPEHNEVIFKTPLTSPRLFYVSTGEADVIINHLGDVNLRFIFAKQNRERK
jgi:hypothetical protein